MVKFRVFSSLCVGSISRDSIVLSGSSQLKMQNNKRSSAAMENPDMGMAIAVPRERAPEGTTGW